MDPMEAFMSASYQPEPGPESEPKPTSPSPPSYSRQSSWRSSFLTTQSPPIELPPVQFSSDVKIEIWLSVFFGNLDPVSPQLDHARFSARINEEVFKLKDVRRSTDSSDGSFGWNSPQHEFPQYEVHQQRLSEDLVALDAIKQLANGFNDEILGCFKGGCSVCQKENPQLVVYRPLSAMKSGYFELPDFVKIGKLLSVIATHTSHVTEKAEVDWCIGNIPNTHPYVCTLAVPVCSADADCSRVAEVKAQAYIDAIVDGRMMPGVAAQLDVSELASPTEESFSSPREDERDSSDYFGDVSFLDTSFTSSSSDPGKLYTVGMTVFVGRPSLRIDGPPKRGQLGCLIFSSSWPKSLLPGPSKNEADDAIDYCRIAGSHEKSILDSADFRCAVCDDLVPATSLVHRPIGFTRTGAYTTLEDSIRKPIMKLFQHVDGRWKSREVNSALGCDSDAHIFDFVVPICKGQSACEEVARTAAHEFIKLLLPSEFRLVFPGLHPDTDLKVLEDAFEDELEWYRTRPHLLISKPTLDGLMTESPDRDEDPNDPSMSITTMRRLYVERFGKEIPRRDSLTAAGLNQLAEYNSPRNEESDVDESSVWIYVRNDRGGASSERGAEAAGHSRSESELRSRLERQLLFRPMMNLDFWMVTEAMERDRSRSRDAAPSPVTVLTNPDTVVGYQESDGSEYDEDDGSISGYSGDTEVWPEDLRE